MLGERNDLASYWQQYSETTQEHMFPSATLTTFDNPKRKETCVTQFWIRLRPD